MTKETKNYYNLLTKELSYSVSDAIDVIYLTLNKEETKAFNLSIKSIN